MPDELTIAELVERAIEIAVDNALGELCRQTGNTLDVRMLREARNLGTATNGATIALRWQLEEKVERVLKLLGKNKRDSGPDLEAVREIIRSFR